MKLNELDIVQIIEGAVFMAGGGGGSTINSYIMLEAFKKKYPEKPVEFELLRVEDMESDKKTAGVAVMGAPSGGSNLDITPCIVNAYDELKKQLHLQNQQITYCLPLELGGFNTFVAILASLLENIPLLDADCCGRAVPGLETTLSHINGCATGPIAMADVDNNRVYIQLENNHDAEKIEELALPIVEQFHQNAGIAGWVYDKKEIIKCLPLNTISICLSIGRILANHTGNVFQAIQNEIGFLTSTISESCFITAFKTEQVGGWDVGSIDFKDHKKTYHIAFSNENLVVYEVIDTIYHTISTVPDIITIYDPVEKKALTNEDLLLLHKEGKLLNRQVSTGILKANHLWYQNHKKMEQVWQRYFNLIKHKNGIHTI